MNAEKKRGHALRNLIVIVVIVAAVFGWRFHQLGQGEAVAGIRAVQEAEGIPVETVVADRGELSQWITMAGTVEGVVQYSVVSNNALRVVGIPVKEGERVEAGDILLRLASGAPSPMYHSVDKSRANYENALVDTKRLRNLFAEGAVSRSDLDAAETRLKVLAADLQDAEGSTALIAGEAGVVSSILVVEGETVETHEPLIWIIDTDRVKLRFEAGSRQAMALAVGQKADWSVAGVGAGGEGEISQLDLMADPATHLLEGEALFENADGRLVPGLLVSFRVRTVNRANIIVLPAECVVDAGDGSNAVWVVDGSGNASLRPIETGMANADSVEIVTGLESGETVVLHGQTLLSDGVKVKRVGAGEES